MRSRATAKKPETLEERFNRLADLWQRETGHLSSSRKMAMHPAYQEIIAMGQPAVPLLLRALVERPDHWDMALEAITRADPVPREDWGNMDRIDQAWLKWGRENGYPC
jgi:hypothetical protein